MSDMPYWLKSAMANYEYQDRRDQMMLDEIVKLRDALLHIASTAEAHGTYLGRTEHQLTDIVYIARKAVA